MKKAAVMLVLSWCLTAGPGCLDPKLIDELPPDPCQSDYTSVDIRVRNFYTGEPLSNQVFSIYENVIYSIYSWDSSIDSVHTRSDGTARDSFRHLDKNLITYYLGSFHNRQFFQIENYPLRSGCENTFDIRMKPAVQLALTLENTKPSGKGLTTVWVWRGTRLHYEGLDYDRVGNTLFTTRYDTLPPHFSQTLLIPAVPDETVIIARWRAPNETRRDTFLVPRLDTVHISFQL
jgi:hypothetical protein